MLTRHSIIIDDVKVYYWMRNPQSAQTMVFIHGFKGNHKSLTELSEYFQDYCTILLDLPGYGISQSFPKQPHTIKNYAQFLQQFIATLGLQQVNLVGHSLGASISLVYASLNPSSLNHLILISPAIPFRSLSQTLAQLQLGVSRMLPRKWRKAWVTSPFIEFLASLTTIKAVSRKRKIKLVQFGIQNAREQRPQVAMECLESFLTTPFYTYAQKIVTPTFILAGELDWLTPLKTQVLLAEHIRQSQIQFMPDVGHLAPIERPGTVGRIIDKAIAHSPNPIPTHIHYPGISEGLLPTKQHKKFSHHKYY
jgi:pimeloyl-ACP methyl ester carboxylesterase